LGGKGSSIAVEAGQAKAWEPIWKIKAKGLGMWLPVLECSPGKPKTLSSILLEKKRER
jgi:hypothetical protein